MCAVDSCPPAAKFKAQHGRSCHQNVAFAQAASICLSRLQKLEDVLQSQLSTQLAVQMNTSDSQAKFLNAQATSLAQLSTSLAALEYDAIALKKVLNSYSAQFNLPGGISADEMKALGLSDYFANFPCYQQNQASLSTSLEKVTSQVEQLSKTKTSIDELRRKTELAERSLAPVDAVPQVVKKTHGIATPAPFLMPATKNGNSDISGAEKQK